MIFTKRFISDNKAAKKHFIMSRKSRKRFGNLKCAAKVGKGESLFTVNDKFFYAFVQV